MFNFNKQWGMNWLFTFNYVSFIRVINLSCQVTLQSTAAFTLM